MALTKKLRFEVFKRDGFKCQYCGKTPPNVTLEVDHIQPKSKQGKDDINNLITSCFDCNRGKSNIELKRIPNTLVENKEILEEQERQFHEYSKLLAKINKRVNSEVSQVEDVFSEYFQGYVFTESFKLGTVKMFLKKLTVFELIDSMHLACSKFENSPKVFYYKGYKTDPPSAAQKYFCGICHNKIKEQSIGIKD